MLELYFDLKVRNVIPSKMIFQTGLATTNASNEDENENEEVFYCVLTYFSTAADIIPWWKYLRSKLKN